MKTMAIGDFEFINLSVLPSGPQRRVSREMRPGVNGVTLWDTGVRSEVIQLESVVDVADNDSGISLVRQYEALSGNDPTTITFAGDTLDGLLVNVISVEPVSHGVHATVIGVGGLRGNSQGLVRCIWTLQPIHPTKEQRA